MSFNVSSEEKICANCKFFMQHYALLGGKFVRIYVGHCMFPRTKNRKVCDTCDYFIDKDKAAPNCNSEAAKR